MRKKGIPEKSTINLAQRELKLRQPGKGFYIGLIAVISMLLVIKVGIIDLLSDAARAEAQAAQQEELVQKVQGALADYDGIQQSYEIERQTQPVLSGYADPMDCLALVKSTLLSASQVESFTISPERITVRLSGITLNEVSAIFRRLTESKLVSGVQVYTAAAEDSPDKQVTATMTISLITPASDKASASDAAVGGEGAAS